MRFLDAGQILAIQDLNTEDVPVPEWGEDVGVRVSELNLSDRIRYLNEAFVEVEGKRQQKPSAQALMLSMVIVDDKGNHIFDEADVKTLMKKSPRAAERIIVVAMRLSGFSGEAVDDAAKNSEADRSGASSSGSPSPSA